MCDDVRLLLDTHVVDALGTIPTNAGLERNHRQEQASSVLFIFIATFLFLMHFMWALRAMAFACHYRFP